MNFRAVLPLPLVFALAAGCDTGEESFVDDDALGGPAGKADGAAGKADGAGEDEPGSPFGLNAVQCWDQSFAYNVLTAFEEEDGVGVELQGATLSVIDLQPETDWWQLHLHMHFESDECEWSDDGTLLSCWASDKAVSLESPFGDPQTTEGTFAQVRLDLSQVTRTTVSGVFEGHEVVMTTTNEQWESRTTQFSVPSFGHPGCNYDPTTFQF